MDCAFENTNLGTSLTCKIDVEISSWLDTIKIKHDQNRGMMGEHISTVAAIIHYQGRALFGLCHS